MSGQDNRAEQPADGALASFAHKVERVAATPEDKGELVITALFSYVAERLSPSFAAGKTNAVDIAKNFIVKGGYEVRPGEFIDLDLSYKLELTRTFARKDEIGSMDDDAEDDVEDGGNIAVLDGEEAADDKGEYAPDSVVTSLELTEIRSHSIDPDTLPEAYRTIAASNGWLREDAKNDYYAHTNVTYIITLTDGRIAREETIEYEVNGEEFDESVDVDEAISDGLIEAKEPSKRRRHLTRHEKAWDREVSGVAAEAELDTAGLDAMVALSRQFKLRQRQAELQEEYTRDAIRVLWQMVPIDIPGFTDEHTPNRL